MKTNEILNPSKWLAVDQVKLKQAFEVSGASTQAEVLAGASECYVESAGDVVFIAGTLEQRIRAREYCAWMVVDRFGENKFVTDVFQKRDMLQVRMENEVSKSEWLR